MGQGEPQTILVADDDPDIRGLLRARLGKSGYRVTEVEDGDRALEAVRAAPPDLLILDVMMPGRSGWEVLRELKSSAATSAVPVLVLSAIGPTVNEMTSPLYGADDHLDKPFELAELEQKIGALLGADPAPPGGYR